MTDILVIDDDELVREMLQELLRRAGYEVSACADGLSGVEFMKEDPAKLVITDIIMPEQEGVETIQILTRDFPDTKIIAISGGGQNKPENYLPLAEKFGASKTFAKPFVNQDLLDAVAELLGSS